MEFPIVPERYNRKKKKRKAKHRAKDAARVRCIHPVKSYLRAQTNQNGNDGVYKFDLMCKTRKRMSVEGDGDRERQRVRGSVQDMALDGHTQTKRMD